MTIYLIRHGEAAQKWDEAPDPPLSENGQRQAVALSKKYLPSILQEDFQLIASPLLRARQTALPFRLVLKDQLIINENFAEIPSPGVSLKGRRAWLTALFYKKVTELEPPQMVWRNNIIQAFSSLEKNTLIFSHFMTINAITGWITGNEQVVNYRPNYCSITKITKKDGQFKIESFGEELPTKIS